jgi:hypothetical protein
LDLLDDSNKSAKISESAKGSAGRFRKKLTRVKETTKKVSKALDG